MHIMTAFGWREIECERVIPAGKTPTLLEQMGIRKQPPGRIGDAYCRAIDLYLDKKIEHKQCVYLKAQAISGNI